MSPLALVFALYYFCGVPLFLYYTYENLEESNSPQRIVRNEVEDEPWNIV